jgi:hypothetical protein
LGSDIPALDGKNDNHFLQCTLWLAPDAALALEEELADLLRRGDGQPAVHDGHIGAALLEAGQQLLLLTAAQLQLLLTAWPLLARGRRAPT